MAREKLSAVKLTYRPARTCDTSCIPCRPWDLHRCSF